jgi:hypothetical protein
MRYKVGWYIPQQIIGLTHLHPVVSQEDFMEIMAETQACLQEVNQPFHVIIDNRIIASEEVTSLEGILYAIPELKSLPLGYIIMILPYRLQERDALRETQTNGTMHLKYVDSLVEAFETFRKIDANLKWEQAVDDFFANDIQA